MCCEISYSYDFHYYLSNTPNYLNTVWRAVSYNAYVYIMHFVILHDELKVASDARIHPAPTAPTSIITWFFFTLS